MADRTRSRRGRHRKNTQSTSDSEESASERTFSSEVANLESDQNIQDDKLEEEASQVVCDSEGVKTRCEVLKGNGDATGLPEQGEQTQLENAPHLKEKSQLEDHTEIGPVPDFDGDDDEAVQEDAAPNLDFDDISGSVDKAELEKLFDPKWAELIKKLPEICDPGLVLEENTHKEGNTKLTYQVPMMPLAECIKDRWDDVNKELAESSQISPFRKLDDKRYWISGEDFKKYCQSSTIDREFCIELEKEAMRAESDMYGGPPRRRPRIKKSNAIRNPLLQSCENGFKKCDESARMAIRASSHAAFMINAVRNVLEKTPHEQQADVMQLIDGIQNCVESVADSSARVVARSTVTRRNICMAQLRQREGETYEDFVTLPMDSKNLFHGEFYPTMQTHKKANASFMKRKLLISPGDLDRNPKRPLMEGSFVPQRSGFDQRDSYGGRFGSPSGYGSWRSPYNEGRNTFSSGRGGGARMRRGNKW